jgi:hypothetical protein
MGADPGPVRADARQGTARQGSEAARIPQIGEARGYDAAPSKRTVGREARTLMLTWMWSRLSFGTPKT